MVCARPSSWRQIPRPTFFSPPPSGPLPRRSVGCGAAAAGREYINGPRATATVCTTRLMRRRRQWWLRAAPVFASARIAIRRQCAVRTRLSCTCYRPFASVVDRPIDYTRRPRTHGLFFVFFSLTVGGSTCLPPPLAGHFTLSSVVRPPSVNSPNSRPPPPHPPRV